MLSMPEPETDPSRDTIAATATPPGRGGIGIVRLSGPGALAAAAPLLGGLPGPLVPAQARFYHLLDPATGAKLDEAIVTWFQAPRSYTGEDVVEIAAHGSPVLLEHLLRLLLARGARLAAPGEFTERAFLSGRLDLTQAEAVRDLIDAQTLLGAQVAAQQLGGALSRRVAPLKQELIALIAVLEAGIDFAEDDTPVVNDADLEERLLHLQVSLTELERSFKQGRLLTEGLTLAIVGRPNAGKSSLFNRLLERERAIVTAEPGTTRDTVQERLSLGGIPVELVDTAGLREAANEAERIGITRSREAFADAGLVLLVLDSTAALNAEEEALLHAAEGRPLLVALNKSDLLGESATDGATESTPETAPETAIGTHGRAGLHAPAFSRLQELAPSATIVSVSALRGNGIDTLRTAMHAAVTGEGGFTPDSAMLTNLRQHTAVRTAQTAIEAALAARNNRLPHELLLLDLYTALGELDALTGATTPDDVLNLIFSSFCIGK